MYTKLSILLFDDIYMHGEKYRLYLFNMLVTILLIIYTYILTLYLYICL